MTPPCATGVIHGRFQVLHNDHLRYLLAGKALCRFLVVGITNPDPGHTRPEAADPLRSAAAANPLTYYERALLVRVALVEAGVPLAEFMATPLPVNLPELIHHYAPRDAAYFLSICDDWGRAKLARFQSLGLATHVLWDVPPEDKGISGAQVRSRMVAGGDWQCLVPPGVARLLAEWDIPARLRAMSRGETP
jgi:nicotinamide-nucleotide adenylyltransferase